MKLVDTTFLIDLSRNNDAALKKLNKLEEEPRVYFSEISRFEMVVGTYALGGDTLRKIDEVNTLLSDFESLPLNEAAATMAGKIAGELLIKGKSIESSDCMIAGIALANSISTIVTRNKTHFERIPGIIVETY